MDFLDRAVAGTVVPEVRPRPRSLFDSCGAGPEPEWERVEELEPADPGDGGRRPAASGRPPVTATEGSEGIEGRARPGGAARRGPAGPEVVGAGSAGSAGPGKAPVRRTQGNARRGPAATVGVDPEAGDSIATEHGDFPRREAGAEGDAIVRESVVLEAGATTVRAVVAVPGKHAADLRSDAVPRGEPSIRPPRPPAQAAGAAGTAGAARASSHRDHRTPGPARSPSGETAGHDERPAGHAGFAPHEPAAIAFPGAARVRSEQSRRRGAPAAEPSPAGDGLPGVPPRETVVHVSIGRIEVRAERPAKPTPATRPRPPAPAGLDEYLRRRDEARR
ncbi:hypothetical protein ACQP2F_19005 [Actinoplanes sp. CA-030573]|uniref:hypothetical protein n=1 Tax=Actinoplanes sp. CA-030573 TaxID=3239898 RepID=UPI003D8A0FCB